MKASSGLGRIESWVQQGMFLLMTLVFRKRTPDVSIPRLYSRGQYHHVLLGPAHVYPFFVPVLFVDRAPPSTWNDAAVKYFILKILSFIILIGWHRSSVLQRLCNHHHHHSGVIFL
jgi:hypothetical protein